MSEEAQESVVEQTEQTEQAVERPEWLPEKFNTPEDMATSYANLESKIGQKEEDLRKNIEQEMQDNLYKNRPASVGDYQLPETVDAEQANQNELLQWWANTSFDNGFSQEQFEEGLNIYANELNAAMPNLEEEYAKLGDNADARIDAVKLWANANFPQELMPAMETLGSTAEGIQVMEMLIEKLKGTSINGQAQPAGVISQADLEQMMKDPRYWNPKDRSQDFVNQVDEGFAKLHNRS